MSPLRTGESWRVEYTSSARKQLRRLDRQVGLRILAAIDQVAGCGDPRSTGRALLGGAGRYWRYRVGSWRIIVAFDDAEELILVPRVGPRGSVYRR